MERAMKQAAKVKDASPHWVFTFGAGRAEGDAAQRDLLGGKGAYLAEMSRLGLPVPPGLTISSEVCAAYYQADKTLPEALMPMVSAAPTSARWRARASAISTILCSCRCAGRAPRCPA
jgi:pyruvate,orthophosphate dikinase